MPLQVRTCAAENLGSDDLTSAAGDPTVRTRTRTRDLCAFHEKAGRCQVPISKTRLRSASPLARRPTTFLIAPFPSTRGCFAPNGPQRSRARRFCAAKRTLDRCGPFGYHRQSGKGAGPQSLGCISRAPVLLQPAFHRRSPRFHSHSLRGLPAPVPVGVLHLKGVLLSQRRPHKGQGADRSHPNAAVPVGMLQIG
jgi:hypothetical protein